MPFPESLEKALEIAGSDEALSETDLMAGWSDPDGSEGNEEAEAGTEDRDPGGWMLPSLGGLGEQGRAELLHWLRAQTPGGDRA